MFKCQKVARFLFQFFFIAFFLGLSSAFGQTPQAILSKADSLFQQKKYTEAFNLYEKLDQMGTSTPSMYLKMAYINEALENISEAMYYLNKYYLSSKNKLALKKMENLAEEKKLAGYDYSDFEFVENLIQNFGSSVNLFFTVVILILFFILSYQKIKRKTINNYLAYFILVFVVLIIINTSLFLERSYGIIENDHCFVMSAPSSGAQLLAQIDEGNRYPIKDYDDIWTKVDIDHDRGFIRTDDLLLIKERQTLTLWLIDQLKVLKK